MNQPPSHLSHPPIIFKTIQGTWHSWYKCDNLINVEVKGMMKYSTYTWNLARKLKSASLPPARHQPPSLIPTAQTITEEKTKQSRNEVQLPTNHMYCLGLSTQNTGPREVNLEPSPKRGSDKINMLKKRRSTSKKAICIVQPELTYASQHLEM